jgi:hypothetical protein
MSVKYISFSFLSDFGFNEALNSGIFLLAELSFVTLINFSAFFFLKFSFLVSLSVFDYIFFITF